MLMAEFISLNTGLGAVYIHLFEMDSFGYTKSCSQSTTKVLKCFIKDNVYNG